LLLFPGERSFWQRFVAARLSAFSAGWTLRSDLLSEGGAVEPPEGAARSIELANQGWQGSETGD